MEEFILDSEEKERTEMKEFIFHGIITKEEEQYTAICLELDITSIGGKSPEQAREKLKEAVEEHMSSIPADNGNDKCASVFAPEEVMEKYSTKLIEILRAPHRFPEFYQYQEVAAYA